MSRLTASPFHKTSAFEFPRQPLSPPETSTDSIGPALLPVSMPMGVGADTDQGEPRPLVPVTESASARFRKVSTLAYHHSGLRESRERTVQKNPKSFVIVVPPSTFLHEHGQLGHTLSSGPRHRLSQGILMPLFPTMYGQLAAIAREFNFPTTAGLCIYLHFTDNGITITPRISDESWQFLWSHVFDERSVSPVQKPPISGKIEFDVDLHQARWYSSWIASSQRSSLDVPISVTPSRAPSVIHDRRDSRTTFAEDQAGEDSIDSPFVQQSQVSTAKHLPRKLSLVDRFDTLSVRSGPKPAFRPADLSSPDQVGGSQILSTITQEDEPKTAKEDLERRVNSWRASATLETTSLAAKGQTSLEPANMPNSLPLDDTPGLTIEHELNLEDFTWSVSSEGPGDYDPHSPSSWYRLPSVHLANRMETSVCLTPSDCTSFGPSDYDLPSPVPSLDRLPSPDLAQRMFEDAPLTPLTMTSWGAPLSYPPSPLDDYRAPSVDIGERQVFSRPGTPLTATSWGPSSWPTSLVSDYRPRSVHLGLRGDYSRPVTPSTATSWGPPMSYPLSPTTPYHVNTPDTGQRVFDPAETAPPMRGNAPWTHGWPYHKNYVIDEGQHQFDDSVGAPWSHVWPYWKGHFVNGEKRVAELAGVDNPVDTGEPGRAPWSHTWPYWKSHSEDEGEDTKELPQLGRPVQSDELVGMDESAGAPWSHTWPYWNNRVENSEQVEKVARVAEPTQLNGITRVDEPARAPWSHNWPYRLEMERHQLPVLVSEYSRPYRATYPHFNLYPTISAPEGMHHPLGYPHFDLYPPECTPKPISTASLVPIVVRTVAAYPAFDFYPAVYPGNLDEIYPPTTYEGCSVKQFVAYPLFDLYPAIYSEVKTYPTITPKANALPSTLRTSQYPDFNLYLATAEYISSEQLPGGYPNFDLYPMRTACNLGEEFPPNVYPNFDLYPAILEHVKKDKAPSNGYPKFDLYPPIGKTPKKALPNVYPNFDIYPAFSESPRKTPSPTVYPNFDLYPDMSESPRKSKSPSPSAYPNFDLYPDITENPRKSKSPSPTAYPNFDLYPVIIESPRLSKSPSPIAYPNFDLYPAISESPRKSKSLPSTVYPNFVLYPVISETSTKSPPPTMYPNFDLYPGVSESSRKSPSPTAYSNFDLYPNIHPSRGVRKFEFSVRLHAIYPAFDLYPVVYPAFNIYPSIEAAGAIPRQMPAPSAKLGYPYFILYLPVYPHFDLYPSVSSEMEGHKQITVRLPARHPKLGRLTHSELRAMVMMESFGSRPQKSRAHKTHDELHREVFREKGSSQRNLPSPMELVPLPHRGSENSSTRHQVSASRSSPESATSPMRSPSTRRLPTPPSSGSRLSNAFDVMSSLISESGALQRRSSVSSRPISIAGKMPQIKKGGLDVPLLSPVDEGAPRGMLNRANSAALPSHSAMKQGGKLDRANSTSAVAPVRKRDSIVLQRVKAYNTSADEGVTPLSMDALLKFPMPPRPPVPPVPRALDRSKYPFS